MGAFALFVHSPGYSKGKGKGLKLHNPMWERACIASKPAPTEEMCESRRPRHQTDRPAAPDAFDPAKPFSEQHFASA